jgi:hypothetical protein
MVFVGVAGSALGASSVTLCVPSGEGATITTPTSGSCGSGTSVQLPSEKAEQEKLLSILPHINYEASGVGGKPTVQFTGVNLQVINGSGSESTLNGTGNLNWGMTQPPGRRAVRTIFFWAAQANLTLATAESSGALATRSPAPMPRSSAEEQTPPQDTRARSPAAIPTRQPPATPPSAAAGRTWPAQAPPQSTAAAPTPLTPATSPQSPGV